MRRFLGVLFLLLLPSVAAAQDVKRPTLADYVGFCLAIWDNSAELSTKASALGLQNATGGTADVAITIDKAVIKVFKLTPGPGTVGAFFTTMEDGKESSCDINLPIASERADLEAMAQALNLDGQLLTMGPATMGHWKIRKRQPAVLVRSILGKGTTTLTLTRFEPKTGR